MKLNHSPLRWNVDETHDSIFIYSRLVGNTVDEIHESGGNIVVEGKPTLIRRANMDFIARSANSYEEMLAALKQATDLITEEYCSHSEPHGPDTKACYAQEQYKAITKAEGKG